VAGQRHAAHEQAEFRPDELDSSWMPADQRYRAGAVSVLMTHMTSVPVHPVGRLRLSRGQAVKGMIGTAGNGLGLGYGFWDVPRNPLYRSFTHPPLIGRLAGAALASWPHLSLSFCLALCVAGGLFLGVHNGGLRREQPEKHRVFQAR
jgi:hypothetical protein